VAPVHPGQPEDVLCFATPALSSSLEVVGAATGSPVQRCEASWRAGLLGRSTPPAHLVTCVLLSGAYAVFPADGDDVCTRQGLPAALPPSAGATAEQRLTVALTQLDNRDVCATVPEARSVVTGDLRHLGLSGWKVEVISPAQPKLAPCAQAAVLNVQSEVAIISVGRLSPPAS
jgi:hypothetical protein